MKSEFATLYNDTYKLEMHPAVSQYDTFFALCIITMGSFEVIVLSLCLLLVPHVGMWTT